jgi:hypothetical protein
MESEALTPGQKLRLALELFESGRELMRAKIKREGPGLSDLEIEQRLAAWVSARPGAEHGDSSGLPRRFREPAA